MNQEQLVKHILEQRSELIGYAWSIVRDDHAAEDLFQEVCVVAIQKAQQIQSREHLSGWLRRALRFQALKSLRHRRTGPQLLDEAVLEAIDAEWDAAVIATRRERTEHLAACMQKLSPRTRRLVEVRYLEGTSGQALADQVGRSLNAVYVGLSRAHRLLEQCMRRRMGEHASG